MTTLPHGSYQACRYVAFSILTPVLMCHMPQRHHGRSVTPPGVDQGMLCDSAFWPQVADEYGTEAYRGSLDLTLHDPAGKQIHTKSNMQDDEVEVEAHGVKVKIFFFFSLP